GGSSACARGARRVAQTATARALLCMARYLCRRERVHGWGRQTSAPCCTLACARRLRAVRRSHVQVLRPPRQTTSYRAVVIRPKFSFFLSLTDIGAAPPRRRRLFLQGLNK